MVDYIALDEDIVQDMIAAMGKGLHKAIEGQVEQANHILHDFSAYITEDAPQKIVQDAHILKASASQMGLRGIFLLARDVQESAEADCDNEHISSQTRELVHSLQRAYPSALERLKAYIAGEDISPNG